MKLYTEPSLTLLITQWSALLRILLHHCLFHLYVKYIYKVILESQINEFSSRAQQFRHAEGQRAFLGYAKKEVRGLVHSLDIQHNTKLKAKETLED